jgi:plastocyanin
MREDGLRRLKRFGALGVAIGLTGVMTLPTQAVASHAGTLMIQVSNPYLVGANCDPETFKGCRTGESMRFMAPTLNVHKGDTLTFDFPSFHTASLLPTTADFLAFRAANTGGVGKPYSLVIPDTDDTTEEGAAADKPAVKANPAVAFPSVGGAPADCGAATNPCSYDGTAVVNSGLPIASPPDTFSVTIDADAGKSFWLICFVHTHMNLRVNIVADTAAATTQADVDAAKATLAATDEEWANETDAKLINARSSHVTASGQKVYDVAVGYDNHFASLDGFYPRKTSVPKGSTVRFHFEQLIYEDHTVTMPAPSAFNLFDEFFVPMCDPDGDAGAGPDTSDTPGPTGPCGGDFSKAEIDITSRVMYGIGDGVFTGASDLEHSGLRGAQFGLTNFDMKFKARSSDGGWKVFCMLHPMEARIVVKPTT